MSITRLAIEKNRITWVILLVVIYAGISAYSNLPRSEDPGFTIRVAQIATIFPGASPERVEDLVTDKLESVIQEIPELDFVNSESRTGLSLIYVSIRESYMEMRPIWDNLRRKINRAAADLPEGVFPPIVNDEFGDVFGIILTLTGEGFNYAELKDVADQVRDDLLNITDVGKVDIYGAQEERIFVEYDNARLAQLGLSPGQLQQILQAQNILYPGGKITTGHERIVLEPTGSYESLEELKQTIINLPGRRDVLYLGDIAHIYRGYIDPPEAMMRYNGSSSLGLGISMREGGNIITMGEQIRDHITYLQTQYPVGVEFNFIAFQPDEVNRSVDRFVVNMLQAVVIVMLVMLLTLGFRTGLVVSSLIPVTMLLALAVMNVVDIGMNVISLSALIISLGLLVDNAIVMSESILVLMQEGQSPIDAAVESARELRVPLLTSSLTTAAAFMPIALAESDMAEYTGALFYVTGITLLCSWLLSLTMIPLLCVLFIKVKARTKEESYNTRFYRKYRSFLIAVLRRPVLSILAILLLFFGGMQLSRFIPNIFFPSSDRAFLTARLSLPIGTPIDQTQMLVDEIEEYISKNLLVNEDRFDGVTSWATFIGSGAPRFYLSLNPDPPAENFAFMLVNTTTREAADVAAADLEQFCLETFPDLNAIIDPLDYGPPITAPVQIRLSGKDSDLLFTKVEQVKEKLANIEGTKNISDDWGARTKKLLVRVDQPRARRAGVTSADIAFSLQTILSGIETTQYREGDNVFPITLRAVKADRQDLSKLETLDVFSQATGKTVPLKQVADLEVAWEPSKILRRDRMKTVTVECFITQDVTATDIVNRIQPWLEEQRTDWEIGYKYEFGGEIESSVKSQAAIGAKLPMALAAIVLLLVLQFNSLRKPLIILLTIPLALVGINIGLLLTGSAFGFMTFLGMISLAGIVINNAIVLIDRIRLEREENNLDPRRAILEASQKRLRPILLTTATTVGGMLPLWFSGGPLFESMAIAIISGLIFATILTLGVVPLLYSLFYKVKFKGFEY